MSSLPTIISVSKSAYRMYRAMCESSEEGEPTARPTSPKHARKTPERVFSSNTQAFLVAVAIGILRNKKETPSEKLEQLIRGEYLRRDKNYEAFRRLIKSKYDATTDHEIVDLMIKFSEAGVRELYDEFHKTGDIDFVKLAKLASLDVQT